METVNFYYNINMNICAEEDWVAGFLVENEDCENKEEALDGLRSCREFCGWIDCDVSNTIAELINNYYGVW